MKKRSSSHTQRGVRRPTEHIAEPAIILRLDPHEGGAEVTNTLESFYHRGGKTLEDIASPLKINSTSAGRLLHGQTAMTIDRLPIIAQILGYDVTIMFTPRPDIDEMPEQA